MDFLNTLEPLLRTFWYIAIPTSLIFVIQTIITFLGADATDGLEPDFNGNMDGADAPFQLFSLRNLINFLLGFSWTGISFFSLIQSPILLILTSILVGVLFVAAFFFIIKQLLKLSEDNSFKIENTLHKTAEVYLNIPANKSGHGKILISVNGSSHELMAMTENNEEIKANTMVVVSKIEHNDLVIVNKI